MIYDNIWFINKATDIHRDKYDYSLVNYVNSKTKIKIICSIHGEFEQTPDKHIHRKQGCPYCGGTKKLTTNEFIIKAKKIHNDKYDYSLVDYNDSHIKVKIICPEHGEFEQFPYSHLNGYGCSECGYRRKNFVENAKKLYGNKFDYSLVDYKNTYTKVKIICPIHGEFEQFPQPHLKYGCALCNRENKFIQNAKLIHNDKYDYSLVKYINDENNVKIICSIHGEFEQLPKYHIRGNGCKKCSDDIKRLDTDNFIMRAKKIHGNKYDYSLVKYVGAFDKVKIICPTHGEFEQKASEHINNNRGCPFCKESLGEREITKFLTDSNILFTRQKKFKDCINVLKLPFDFYLPKYNICVEFDGIQHYIPIKYFGGIKKLIYTQNNDKIKTDFCIKNNIQLIRIKYDDNIIDKLKNNII
jgi:hypothetical protein